MPTTNFTLTVNTGSSNWTNPANAIGQDAVYATATSGFRDLVLTYDGSVIPSNAALGLITITARGYATGFTGPEFYLGYIGNRSFSDGSPLAATLTATVATYTLANQTAASLGVDYSHIAGNSLQFRNRFGSGTGTFFIDHITFSVEWTAPPAGNALFFGENF